MAYSGNIGNPDEVFEPGCWRFVSVKDLTDAMSEKDIVRAGLSGLDAQMIMARITWSRAACELTHGPGVAHSHPYVETAAPGLGLEQPEPHWESDAASVISIGSTDSEETIMYGYEEEEVSTSLDTSTWGSDTEWDGDEWEAARQIRGNGNEAQIAWIPAGAEEEEKDQEYDGFSLE